MWKNPATSHKLYVTALPGTKKKLKKSHAASLQPGERAGGELPLLAMQHRSVKHVVISI